MIRFTETQRTFSSWWNKIKKETGTYKSERKPEHMHNILGTWEVESYIERKIGNNLKNNEGQVWIRFGFIYNVIKDSK